MPEAAVPEIIAGRFSETLEPAVASLHFILKLEFGAER